MELEIWLPFLVNALLDRVDMQKYHAQIPSHLFLHIVTAQYLIRYHVIKAH